MSQLERVRQGLRTMDELLAGYARLFGVGFVDPLPRTAALISVYGLIYAIARVAPAPLALLAVIMGYIGVLAIGRAWTQNEKLRTRIAHKLEDLDPDSLPDLRLGALISALQLFALIPLLLELSHRLFNLYDVDAGVTMSTWLAFGVDLFFRSLLDWSEVYDVHVSDVQFDSIWGRHLVMFILLTIDFILIQGIIRLVSIQRTVSQGVAVAGKDPEMAFRLGKRATKPLSAMVADPMLDADVRNSAIEALGMIGDANGCGALVNALSERELHTNAVAALVHVGHYNPILDGCRNPNPLVRRGCLSALGRLGDSLVIEQVGRCVDDPDTTVRVHAHEALGRISHNAALPFLARGLDDHETHVRHTALQQIGQFEGDKAIPLVIQSANDRSPTVRRLSVELLARFPDARVVPILVDRMEDDDKEVCEAAKRSLAHLESLVDGGAA